jgi:hypothetical protein
MSLFSTKAGASLISYTERRVLEWHVFVSYPPYNVCSQLGQNSDGACSCPVLTISFPFWTRLVLVTEPPQNEGLIDQDQLERFSAKREYNQHTKAYNTILSLSRSYYTLGSRIKYTKEVWSQNSLQKIFHSSRKRKHSCSVHSLHPKRECHPLAL